MKNIILGALLLLGMTGFSENLNERYIEKCKITSKGKYKNGTKYLNCTSKKTGKKFNFIEAKDVKVYHDWMEIGDTYAVWFLGNGYKNLRIVDFRTEK
ncbi:hypothetical protein EII29_06820 [Leptotrichia sp. OH3620_COT-345]|uniref:hypothetical protein n=1 Tax=Leptotrichia sp. OH3620_COT-345 TaxID=2491048 RepID=UPI000F6557C9|nr:hypothetical protein [Leptotrichia sp. OH3620_COT-345]RRD39517.1 hypothetical protein EII29_06820 [Leptotrichia sp. OH3620_COT-345]